MKRIVKRAVEWIIFLFTCQGSIADQAVEDGLCDFSGQGK